MNSVQNDPLSVSGWAWAYLLLGFTFGLGLLLHALLGTGGLSPESNPVTWALGIFGLSLIGWALLRNFRTIEGRISVLFQDRQFS